MIWFFTRGSAQVDIEVRQVSHNGAWELIVDYPDGSETVKRIRNPRRLVERTLKLQQRLIREGWVPTGPAGTGFRTLRPIENRRRRYLRNIGHLLAQVRQDVARRLSAAFGL